MTSFAGSVTPLVRGVTLFGRHVTHFGRHVTPHVTLFDRRVTLPVTPHADNRHMDSGRMRDLMS